MSVQHPGRAFARAFIFAFTIILGGCQSASLPFLGGGGKADSEANIDSAQLPPAQTETQAAETQAKGVPAEGAAVAQAAHDVAPVHDSVQSDAQAGASLAQAGGQGSLLAAAANQSETPGVQRIDTKGGAGAGLSRRLNKLLGRSNVATPSAGPQVSANDVAGVWRLDEEDGLRVCTLTLSSDAGSQVLRAPNCDGFVQEVASWGLFGPELQLRDGVNTVIARLRQSGEGWVGFTTVTGVPLVLSKG